MVWYGMVNSTRWGFRMIWFEYGLGSDSKVFDRYPRGLGCMALSLLP